MNKTLWAFSLVTPLAVIACSTQVSPSQAQQDIEIITNGLNSILNDVEAIPNVPADTLKKVQAELAVVNKESSVLGQAIASASGPNPDDVKAFSDAVNAMAGILEPFFPQAPTVAVAINAATTLVQEVMVQLNMSNNKAAAPSGMSPGAARLILEGMASR